MDYFRQMNRLERKLYENGVGAELLSDAYVTHATTSTRFLAGKLAERGKEVILVTNKLSSEDVRLAETLFAEREKRPHDGALRICYLSGTPSHNRDFATINEPLLRILARYKETRLVLAGPLDTEDVLNRFADRIERIPYAPRAEYFKTVSGMDINLAPLEIGNPFCEAKSELKFFESGIVGVPTVAAGTATFQEAIEDGVDGFVASGAEEWFEKLSRLIEDEALRKEMGRRARQTALARYTTASGASPEYYAYLRSVLNP
jgi:glycosyltransferase involved in cell wall biosynthesis